MSEVSKIMLGDGIFSINGTPIARTRGGGSFSVEREYREIDADGDYGAVKGRIRKIGSRPHLVLNLLTLISADLKAMYPSTEVLTGSGVETWQATNDIADADYNDVVSFTGETKSGKQVHIEIYNAINLENIEWDLVDKEEVVPEINYSGTYLEGNRKNEPWKVEYAVGDVYTVTFTVSDGSPVVGANVYFYNSIVATNSSGVAVFSNVPVGDNYEYKVVKGGFATYFGAVDVVDADVAEAVSL